MNKQYMDFVPANRVRKEAVEGVAAAAERAAEAPVPEVKRTTDIRMAEVRRVRPTGATGERAAGAANERTASAAGERMAGAVTEVRQRLAEAARKVEKPAEVDDFAMREIFEEKVEKTPAGVTKTEVVTTTKLGVIEDLGPRFINTEVPKRALGRVRRTAEDDLREAKAEKLVGRGTTRSALSGRKLNENGELKAGASELAGNRIGSSELTGRRMSGMGGKMSVAEGAMTAINAGAYQNRAKTGAEPVENPVENSTLKVPKFVKTAKVEKRPLSKNVYQKQVVAKEEPQGPVTIITKPEKDSKAGMVLAVIITIILGATAGTVAFLLLPK